MAVYCCMPLQNQLRLHIHTHEASHLLHCRCRTNEHHHWHLKGNRPTSKTIKKSGVVLCTGGIFLCGCWAVLCKATTSRCLLLLQGALHGLTFTPDLHYPMMGRESESSKLAPQVPKLAQHGACGDVCSTTTSSMKSPGNTRHRSAVVCSRLLTAAAASVAQAREYRDRDMRYLTSSSSDMRSWPLEGRGGTSGFNAAVCGTSVRRKPSSIFCSIIRSSLDSDSSRESCA
mmetsp:Transcript_13784/g.21909  ORF Transcript_13784/g.21909 Transcript_13784/m.21909 type:complete len:230 (+) Transcript_13784:196-885(+)